MNTQADPKTSIIIPTYNHARFLYAALDSICKQTVSDWEVIVVDNYSKDNTSAVVESFGDRRIRRVCFNNRGIIAAARNHGLLFARGKFIAFLDSDDLWYPTKLQSCLNKLDRGYELVCHSELWVNSDGLTRLVEYGPEKASTYEHLLLEGNCLSTSAVVVCRQRLVNVGGFSCDPTFNTAEDYDLWLKLARDGVKFGFIYDCLGVYRIHGANESCSAVRNMQAVFAVYTRHRDSLVAFVEPGRFRRREALIIYGTARNLQQTRQHIRACRYFIKAISRYPWMVRPYIAMLLNTLKMKL